MLSPSQTYHFVGIGGVGVSAVARVLHQQGVRVQGSDVRESQSPRACAPWASPSSSATAPRTSPRPTWWCTPPPSAPTT
ncbi:MAG: Mur ligase domain-containing protein [bacterium]